MTMTYLFCSKDLASEDKNTSAILNNFDLSFLKYNKYTNTIKKIYECAKFVHIDTNDIQTLSDFTNMNQQIYLLS